MSDEIKACNYTIKVYEPSTGIESSDLVLTDYIKLVTKNQFIVEFQIFCFVIETIFNTDVLNRMLHPDCNDDSFVKSSFRMNTYNKIIMGQVTWEDRTLVIVASKNN